MSESNIDERIRATHNPYRDLERQLIASIRILIEKDNQIKELAAENKRLLQLIWIEEDKAR